jgi:hypothetical protein
MPMPATSLVESETVVRSGDAAWPRRFTTDLDIKSIVPTRVSLEAGGPGEERVAFACAGGGEMAGSHS